MIDNLDFSSIDLFDKRILVTGANGGIGQSIVQGALEAKAQFVMASDLQFDETIKLLKNQYSNLELSQNNLCEENSLNQLIKKAEEKKINVLVNNAAIFDMAPFLESSLEQFDRLFSLNVRSCFVLMQAIAIQLVKREEKGSIINFSSQAGRRGEALVSHYCATKAAIISYTQSAALALAKKGINVNSISPGVIDTPMWKTVDSLFSKYENLPLGEKKKRIAETIPLGRMGVPQDVVGLVLFLASNLSRYITGQTINIDGGNVLS